MQAKNQSFEHQGSGFYVPSMKMIMKTIWMRFFLVFHHSELSFIFTVTTPSFLVKFSWFASVGFCYRQKELRKLLDSWKICLVCLFYCWRIWQRNSTFFPIYCLVPNKHLANFGMYATKNKQVTWREVFLAKLDDRHPQCHKLEELECWTFWIFECCHKLVYPWAESKPKMVFQKLH